MTQDSPATYWEMIRVRLRTVGPGRVALVGMGKLMRPLAHRWRRMRAAHPPVMMGDRDLARALHVQERELPGCVAEVRRAMGRRLPTGPGDASTLRSLYREQAPDELESCVQSADRLCEHVFDLLGSGPISLGERIDWHRDFKSGFRWDPDAHYFEVAQRVESGVDIKVPWELSRCQHLPVLAQAYLLTGRPRYAQEVTSQIADWIDQNRTGRGVNWACPMEVAIRAVNWLWAIALIAESPDMTDRWLSDVLASLISHGRHLMENLERRSDGITTNHYLADVVGLLYLGLCLPECRDSAAWRTFAVRELEREMERQVRADGVHYESSIPYHRLVGEMFLSSALLCRHHEIRLADSFHRKLRLMCDFVSAYTKPNGLAPQVGDGDNGRLHILSGYGTVDPRDHRHFLAVGSVLYDHDEWWRHAGPRRVEALWFGRAGRDRFSRAPEKEALSKTSAAFPSGGLYIIRDRDDYVLFNCSPVGTSGIGTHKHNDILSLELHLDGEDIVVDSGSFLYTADPRMYDLFRSTAHHSTVKIDGREQNRFIPGKFFCLHQDGAPLVLEWEHGDTLDRVSAEFDGYRRLSDPVRHRRDVLVRRPDFSVQVIDHFSGRHGRSTPHTFEWTWTCAPGCRIETVPDGWEIISNGRRVHMTAPVHEPDGAAMRIDATVLQGLLAPSYGSVRDAVWLRWRWSGILPSAAKFTITKGR
ncbi:MAG: heparinase II/III family protein [Nitrospira sp.]